jgi:hypothetical protein
MTTARNFTGAEKAQLENVIVDVGRAVYRR